MVTDPVADLINRLKNAGAVKHATVSVPFSMFKLPAKGRGKNNLEMPNRNPKLAAHG